MSSKSGRKTAEWIKTAAIAVLTLSALLLGWQTRLFNDFLSSIPVFKSAAELIKGTPAAVEDSSGTVTKEAARPANIVITDDAGGHHGVKYDSGEINQLYARTSSIFAEAFGAAAALTPVSEDDWRKALLGPGIYFEYMSPVKLSVLGGWFGSRAQMSDTGVTLRRICVTFGEGINGLYLQDAETGLFYAAGNETSGGRTIEFSAYADNGAVYAFETGLTAAKKAPYMQLMPGNEHPVIRVTEPLGQQEVLDAVLYALGASSQIKPSYSASDGALVYVGAGVRIRVEDGGRALLTRGDEISEEVTPQDEGAMIERARAIIADTIAQSGKDAEVHFEEGTYGEDGSYSVTFYYRISGGRIITGDNGCAARIVFKDGFLIDMELNFRSYEITDETRVLIPEIQALAAAGGEFILCYKDAGTEYMRPDWYPKSGVK